MKKGNSQLLTWSAWRTRLEGKSCLHVQTMRKERGGKNSGGETRGKVKESINTGDPSASLPPPLLVSTHLSRAQANRSARRWLCASTRRFHRWSQSSSTMTQFDGCCSLSSHDRPLRSGASRRIKPEVLFLVKTISAEDYMAARGGSSRGWPIIKIFVGSLVSPARHFP